MRQSFFSLSSRACPTASCWRSLVQRGRSSSLAAWQRCLAAAAASSLGTGKPYTSREGAISSALGGGTCGAVETIVHVQARHCVTEVAQQPPCCWAQKTSCTPRQGVLCLWALAAVPAKQHGRHAALQIWHGFFFSRVVSTAWRFSCLAACRRDFASNCQSGWGLCQQPLQMRHCIGSTMQAGADRVSIKTRAAAGQPQHTHAQRGQLPGPEAQHMFQGAPGSCAGAGSGPGQCCCGQGLR